MSDHMVLMVEALGHWVLGWTLVVLAVAVWIRASRPRRASVRYGGWLLATFAGAVLGPVVLAVGPLASWREVLAVLPTRPAAAEPSDPATGSRSWFDGAPTSFRPESVAYRADEGGHPGEAARLSGRARRTGSPRAEMDTPYPRDRWMDLAAGIWAAGFLLFAARLVWSAWCIRSLLAGAGPVVPAGLDAELETSRRELGIRRRVRIAVHPDIAAPMCVGLLRPVILWPTPENCPMTRRERLASLTHELAHLHHGDDAVALLAEVWRALTWFYPPVHLTVSILRREREFRCDDRAAAKLETPEQYAKWLLDLAPVRVGPTPPFLAASLLGGTSLADRIARIIRGELRWAKPLGRRARAILALAALLILGAAGSVRLVGFAGRAAAEEPADTPLPEIAPAQLAARIRESMGRYNDKGSIRVVFTDTRDMNFKFDMNQGSPEEQKPIMVSFRGRARYESDGSRWRAEYDSMMPRSGSTRLRPDRWSTGFDGTLPYNWHVSQNEFILGESSPSARSWTPRSLIWERSGEELVGVLEETDRDKHPVTITRRVVDGMRCYVVESKSPDGRWGGETVISPRQGYLPIGRKWTHHGRIYSTYTLQGVHEVVPSIWAPDRIEDESTAVRDDGASRLSSRRRIQIVEYQPRRIPPAAAFRPEIPYGVDVTDRRLGTSYRKDPWWPEVGAMLREKFGWPPTDFSPLANLWSHSKRKLEDQPAPPLRVATWLNARPVDLATLRGKVVLVEFGLIGDHWVSQYTAPLRELYSTYHPSGLEIVSIHAPTEDPDAIRRYVRDFRLEYPVGIDERRSGSAGVTAEAFAIGGRPCSFLIDHEGKVHSVGEPTINGGRLVETLVSLLKKAGARDVKAVSLRTPELPRSARIAASDLFESRVKEALDADPPGKITGRVVDGHGRTVDGADVRATLQLTLMVMTSPGGYHTADYHGPAERFRASSGTDGRFELSGLCKGEYLLKVRAPGLAWVEHKAYIAPDRDPAPVEFVLVQGDTISGQVRDPQGQPIARATVTPTWRQHYEGDELQYATSAVPDGVKSDDAGRFRFAGLQQGRYVMEVKAAGFKDRELEPIPVGHENVVVTLDRSP